MTISEKNDQTFLAVSDDELENLRGALQGDDINTPEFTAIWRELDAWLEYKRLRAKFQPAEFRERTEVLVGTLGHSPIPLHGTAMVSHADRSR